MSTKQSARVQKTPTYFSIPTPIPKPIRAHKHEYYPVSINMSCIVVILECKTKHLRFCVVGSIFIFV